MHSDLLLYCWGFSGRELHRPAVSLPWLSRLLALVHYKMAESPVSSEDKYGSLMADRALLTSLMEAAASGNKDSLLSVVRKVEERYGTQASSNTEGGAAAVGDSLSPGVLLGFRDAHGRTVAHFAALGGAPDVLELVIKLCPSAVNVKDNSGKTPLFTAASLGHVKSLELLLNRGADVGASSEGGSTALHEAVYAEKAAAVKLLLEHGSNVSCLYLLVFSLLFSPSFLHLPVSVVCIRCRIW